MTYYKKTLLFIVGIMYVIPTYTMNSKGDKNSKKLLDLFFYHTHESNEELLKAILANKGNPNIQDADGDTPLHLTVNSRYSDYVAILLDVGADPDKKNNNGNSPLHIAAQARYTAVKSIQLLLNNKANPNLVNIISETPLHAAINHFVNPQTVELLLSAKANPNLKNKWGDTPLHKAMEFHSVPVLPAHDMIKPIQLLLQYGAQQHSVNHEDETPLHLLTYNIGKATTQEKILVQKMKRLLVWHYIFLHDFAKLVPIEIANIIASYAALVCAEEPTIWPKRPSVPTTLSKKLSTCICM